MAISVTQTSSKKTTSDAPKTRNVYDNYDKLKSVVHYDANDNVEFVLRASNNASGKSGETKKLYQVHVDVVQVASNISFDNATLTARIYKNDSSTVYETGFIVWEGSDTDLVQNKQAYGDILTSPTIYKGSFSKLVENLKESTTYNYRAYVRHEYGTNYSKVYTFNTISFTSVFSIAGDRFSGPDPLTVNLSAINAGTDDYTYAWNMTGGPISFEYSVSGITITNPGSSYEPDLPRYTLNSIVIDLSGAGYDPMAETVVLVNNIVEASLSAEFGYNSDLAVYGISAVTIPAELSGYKVNTFAVTFSSASAESITEQASGIGTGGSYTIPREFLVLINGIAQPSLSVVNYYNEVTDAYEISAIEFPGELFGFTNSSRTVTISTTDPVDVPATGTAQGSIQRIADYDTQTITHTFSGGGNYNPKAYAILGDQIEKEATRLIRVTGATNFTEEWSSVTQSSFGSNVIAAYDFRNIGGPTELYSNAAVFYDFSIPPQVNFNSPRTQSSLFIGGYSISLGLVSPGDYIGGYDANYIYADGLIGKAARFVKTVGGYGQSWVQSGYGYSTEYIFENNKPFTVSMWVNYTQFEDPGTKIFSIRGVDYYKEYGITQSTDRLSIFANIDRAENYGIAGYLGGYGYPVLTTTDPTKMLSANSWNHIVVTRDANSNYKYYLNGTLQLQGYSDYLENNQNPARIGGNVGGYGYFTIGNTLNQGTRSAPPDGLIDSVAIWRKELSQEAVTYLYNNGQGTEDIGLVKPIVGPKLWLAGIMGGYNHTTFETSEDGNWNNVSMYLDFDGANGSTTFTDSSINNLSLTASPANATISNLQVKYGTGAGRFIGGYVETPAGSDWGAFGTGDFTIEWWQYNLGNKLNDQQGIIAYGNNGFYPPGGIGGYQRPEWQIAQIGGYVRFVIGGYYTNVYPFGYTPVIQTGPPFATNQWEHFAIVRGNNNYSIYRNGIIAGYNNNATSHSFGVGGYLGNVQGDGKGLIGAMYYPEGLKAFDGYIDDLRITKGVARYTSNFTIPASAFPKEVGDLVGVKFTPGTRGSYAETKETISVTYPHTVAFIGKANSINTGEVIYQAIQPIKWSQTNNQNVLIWSRTNQGLMPYNGNDNQFFSPAYIPNGNEYFYIAYSFLGPANGNQVRAHLQTPTRSVNTLLPGNAAAQAFNGYVGYGKGLTTSELGPTFNINGVARLGISINQGFTTHEDMLTLFNAITAGPAQGLPLG